MNTSNERLDNATRQRLAALKQPVDTTALLGKLEAAIADERGPASFKFPRHLTRWLSAAAAIVIVATSVVLFEATQSPALATPVMMQLHEDIQHGRVPMVSVRNMDEARQTVAAAWADAPDLPRFDMPIESCCLRDVKDRRVVCIRMRAAEAPVTVVVARVKDFHPGGHETATPSGHTAHVSTHEGTSMVVTQHGDRWLCMMADLPAEKLIALADEIGRH